MAEHWADYIRTLDRVYAGLSWRQQIMLDRVTAIARDINRQLAQDGPAEPYDGPPYVHVRDVVPAELLATVDHYPWDDQPGVEVWVPDKALTVFAHRMMAEHAPWGLAGLDTEPFREIHVARRVAPDEGLGVHRDHYMGPARRWCSVITYFTDTDGYEGGDLVMVATGERLRPARGDVVLMRGDVEHEVTAITAGARTTMNAFKAEAGDAPLDPIYKPQRFRSSPL